MLKVLKEFFNWKKNPKNVFPIAIPLFMMGLSFHVWAAYLHWVQKGDPVFAYIVLGGIALLAFGLWPIRKELKKLL